MKTITRLMSAITITAVLASGAVHAQSQPTPQPAGSNKAANEATGGLSDGAKVAIGVVVVGGIAAAIASGNKSSGSGTTGTVAN